MPAAAELEISCQSCGAALIVEEYMRTAQCPYCASTSVVERPASPDRPRPQFVLAFVVGQERAAAAVRRWLSSRGLFARADFKRATPEFTRGIYLPTYLYGAVADSQYSAQIGENYTTTETYTTTDSKGKTVTRTRTVTKTEYRSLSGAHACYIVDVLVTASRAVKNQELEVIEPFDLRALRRYTPAVLSGWLAEDPSLTRDRCLALAHDEAVEEVGKRLHAFMPGDSHRSLEYSTELSDEVIDLVLLPVWSFAARYDEAKPPVRILVNGQTGEVAGAVPLSRPKIAAAVIFGVALLVVIILLIAGGM